MCMNVLHAVANETESLSHLHGCCLVIVRSSEKQSSSESSLLLKFCGGFGLLHFLLFCAFF